MGQFEIAGWEWNRVWDIGQAQEMAFTEAGAREVEELLR